MRVQRLGLGWPEVREVWRTLEPACDSLSFFQSWSWAGCLAAERFANPVLLRLAGQGGDPRGLALFNLRAGRLVQPFPIGLPDPYAYWLVHRADRRDDPRIRAFAAWVRREAADL